MSAATQAVPDAALPGTIEHWAAVQPDAVALIEGERQLTWKAWNHQADRLAQALRTHGIQAGDIVVLRLQICLEWPVIAAALSKLGCWLLALSWRLTNTEIRYVLNNSRAKAIICDDADPAALLPAFADQGLKLAVSLGRSEKPERKAGAADRDGMQGCKAQQYRGYCEHLQRGRPPESADARGAAGFSDLPKEPLE